MDLPTDSRAADPLAQPTRARLFKALGELKRSAGTAELAERLGLHPNGIRVHLEQLAAAGLVVRTQIQQARGRPRDAWAIAPSAMPGGIAPRAYSDLGRWLTRVVRSSPGHLESVEEIGREIGREIAPAGAEGQEVMGDVLTALGFQPEARVQPEGGLVYCLGNCPYREAVRENQEVVCTLHRGITKGLLDQLDPTAELTAFIPRDPDLAGCEIKLLVDRGVVPA